MSLRRVALVASEARLGSLREAWQCRAGWADCEPEVHLLDGSGRFLEAAEARKKVPALTAGFNYPGRFSDNLALRRLSVVLAFPERRDGAMEGFLEFLGLPFAGSSLAGCLVAGDVATARAVLGAQGFAESAPGEPTFQVAVLLGSSPVWGAGAPADDGGFAVWGERLCRAAGLSTWALLTCSRSSLGYAWAAFDANPDLDPAGPFLRSLAASGWGSAAVIAHATAEALGRFASENTLKQSYKDGL